MGTQSRLVHFIFSLLIVALTAGCGAEHSSDGVSVTSGFASVRRILAVRCASCHAELASYGESDFIARGYVLPGNPSASSLYRYLRGSGAGGPESMPKDGALAAHEVSSIAGWIREMGPAVTGNPPPPATDVPPAVTAVLQARCVSCHSTFAANRVSDWMRGGYVVPGSAAGSLLYKRLRESGAVDVAADMPKNAPALPASERELLRSWLDTLTPPETPAAARRRAAQAILRARCASCHSSATQTAVLPGYSGAPVPAFTADDFSPTNDSDRAFVLTGLVLPGNPEQSWLDRSLQRSGGPGRMPLGAVPLSESDIAVLRDWIRQMAHD